MGRTNWHHYRDKVGQTLTAQGFSAAASEALLDLDAEMFRMMRSMVKGELPAQLMLEIGTDLELAQFQALTAVLRIQSGMARNDSREATIGHVAAEMNVDPSRASRLVSELIASGHLSRDVSQEDARRSVLQPTAKAMSLLAEFRDLKWQKLMQVFSDWSEEEIVAFSSLFLRFRDGMRAAYPGRE
jgi:DNA-binding MarR family transcriptional regulator